MALNKINYGLLSDEVKAKIGSVKTTEESWTGDGTKTAFTLTSGTYNPNTQSILVFVEGIKQVSGTNFTETNSSTITFSEAPSSGSLIEIVYFMTNTDSNVDITTLTGFGANVSDPINTLTSNLAAIMTNVKVSFNAKGDGSTDDTSAIQSAINSFTSGGTIYFPNGTYVISSPITISNNNINLMFAPNAIITNTVWNKNTLIITGTNCSINGGTIQMPATFNGTNTGSAWLDSDAVILSKGDGLLIDGMTLINVPRIGIGMRKNNNLKVINNTIIGNYPTSQWTGVETNNFGITLDPSTGVGNCIIQGNIIHTCVQGVFIGVYGAGVGYGIIVSNNVFHNCLNHGIYSDAGKGNILNNNSFNECQVGIACVGDHATVSNNTFYTSNTGNEDDQTGISMREATHCVITGNVLKGDAVDQSVMIDLTNLVGSSIDNNIVSDNIIDINANSSIGIRVGNNTLTTTCKNNQVKNNIIKVNGRSNMGLITVYTTSSSTGLNNQVSGNDITVVNNCYAIYLYRQQNALVVNNMIKLEYNATASEVLNLVNSTTLTDSLFSNNIIKCNTQYGSNLNLRGIIEDSTSSGNFVTGNLFRFSGTGISVKTDILIQPTSKSSNNMLEGTYTA